MSAESLPCIVCREPQEAVWDYELQPSEATAFRTQGHYGSTAFDPMDLSELVIVVCDECLDKAGRDQIVALDQPRLPLAISIDGADMAVGYYAPGTREHVEWDPDADYPPERVAYVEPEEVATVTGLPKSAMVRADAVLWAREELAREAGA
jgi:hypothetical protein